MGRDKAALELAGSTLLSRAVTLLRGVPALQHAAGDMIVTIAGTRAVLDGADLSIADHYPECGPLGGFEAALAHLERNDDADWAFFIPVDMPLLRAELIDLLLTTWELVIESNPAIRACLVAVDGRLQPLVSLVHRSVLREVRAALEAGSYKVIPLLQSAGAYCTSLGQADSEHAADTSALRADGKSPARSTPMSDAEPLRAIDDPRWETFVQFTNVNTEADLLEVATLIRPLG